MKVCNKCFAQCPDDATFCDHCGKPFSEKHLFYSDIPPSNEQAEPDLTSVPVYPTTGIEMASSNNTIALQKSRMSRGNILLIVLGGLAVIVTAVLLFLLLRPSTNHYFNLLENGKTTEASEYYEKHFQNNKEKQEEIQAYVIASLNAIQEDYVAQNIDFLTAKVKYLRYSDVPGVTVEYNKVTTFIADLENSRTSYVKAQEFDRDKDYAMAMEYYNQVIQEDEDYEAARARVRELAPLYNEEMITLADKHIANKEYAQAKTAIYNALKYDPTSATLLAKVDAIEKADADARAAAEKARIDALRDAQEVLVTSCASRYEGYAPGYRQATIIMKNNSGKTIKKVYIAALLFDENGKPVNDEGSDENIALLNYEQAEKDGAKFGGDSYWNIPLEAKQIKACVIGAEYSDGTEWSNEAYLEEWYQMEKDAF